MHPIVLDGLAMLLKASSFDVVARCRTGEEARAALAGDINIAVHNIQMPKATGLELLRALRGAGLTRPKIVILIASLERAQLVEAVELETDGLVLKETAGERIVHRSEEVAAGRQWIDNDALLRVVGELARREARAAVTKPLSEREAEVAELAAQDLRNRDIALALGLSESTVKMHLRNVFTKLGVGSRAELAAFPREHRRTSCPLGSADADAVLDQDPDAEADEHETTEELGALANRAACSRPEHHSDRRQCERHYPDRRADEDRGLTQRGDGDAGGSGINACRDR
jgi:DNA-binding NarL/FixJ family response regulator